MRRETSQVFYRKYRPQEFDEVIGQEHVVRVIEGAIKLGNISHAYLFSGPRGTGKTSVARIFSRAVGTSANDLYELDAASNRGIDDVRAIRESVATLPFESRFKIYVLDEVHMLTKDAWNALLKTLEEPPQHVIFILATTEIEKVPETVISRCQTFSFKRPNLSTLREFIFAIVKKEKAALERDAAELVALLSDGSFRDAHGILEKVLSSTRDKKITRVEVEAVTGAPKNELVKDFLEAIVAKNISKGTRAIQQASEQNVDMKVFARLILSKLRFLFLIRLKAGMDEHILAQTSEDEFQFLQKLAQSEASHLTAEVLVRFIDAYENSGRTAIPELALELALADISE